MNMSNGQKVAILVTLTVTVGTFVTTITIANVSLPQLQGAFAATQDQFHLRWYRAARSRTAAEGRLTAR